VAKITYTKENRTGCCPIPDVKAWDNSQITWKNKRFIKDNTINLFHIPLNMGQMMKRALTKIEKSNASVPAENFIMLSFDPSPWKTENYLAVKKRVRNAQNIRLTGTFLTKVFEGPYKNAGKWYQEMQNYTESKGTPAKKIYFFYTTCPKCAKVYSKNYVVAFAQI